MSSPRGETMPKLRSMEKEYDESPEGIKEYKELMRSVLEFNLNYERKWWQKWKQIKPTEKELDEFIKGFDEENSWLFDW